MCDLSFSTFCFENACCNYQGRDENVGQEKKGDSEEEEDAEKEVEQESTDDDDYNQVSMSDNDFAVL